MSFRGKSDSPTPIYRNCSENFSGVSYQMRLEQDRLGSFLRQPSCSVVLFRSMGFRWNTTEARWSYQLRMYRWVLAPGNTHLSWEWDYLEKELTPCWRVGCLVSALSQFFIFFRLSASPSLEEWATQWAPLPAPLQPTINCLHSFFLFFFGGWHELGLLRKATTVKWRQGLETS